MRIDERTTNRSKNTVVFISTSKHAPCRPFYHCRELTFTSGLTDISFTLQQLRAQFNDLLPDSLTQQPLYKIGVGATMQIPRTTRRDRDVRT